MTFAEDQKVPMGTVRKRVRPFLPPEYGRYPDNTAIFSDYWPFGLFDCLRRAPIKSAENWGQDADAGLAAGLWVGPRSRKISVRATAFPGPAGEPDDEAMCRRH